ncbi:polyprenyl synthetase family protein [Alphaproteobacteria bacterium]|nr:polyprenyl synthetase family protein [Alphaproteobacteria bacterium]
MSEITFNKTIQSIHKEIQGKLRKTNTIIDHYLMSDISVIPKLGQYFFKQRGKQLRPVLCLLSSKMINKDYSQLKTDIYMSAAIEFIHAATLLHDDVIDKGTIRRGQKSINEIWNNKFSVLLGDFMFSKSFQLMTKANSLKAMEHLSEVSSKISEGEFLQLSNEKNINLKSVEYVKIISLKTAELFGAAFMVPAILKGKKSQTVNNLYKLGINFGIIFQITDDILDYFGNRQTGKEIGKDFIEGKVTLPIILLIEKVSKNNQLKLKKDIYEKNQKPKRFYFYYEFVKEI